jgi:hypothetical protein
MTDAQVSPVPMTGLQLLLLAAPAQGRDDFGTATRRRAQSIYEFKNGSSYHLGWRSKLSSTVNNNGTFQWKSYGNHIQNFPVVPKMTRRAC